MYVCIEVALRGIAHCYGRSNWAKGPIGIMGTISQPRSTIDTMSLTLDHTHAFNMRFLNQLYSRQLRVSNILM